MFRCEHQHEALEVDRINWQFNFIWMNGQYRYAQGDDLIFIILLYIFRIDTF